MKYKTHCFVSILASFNVLKTSIFKNSFHILLLNDSQYPFSYGLLGSIFNAKYIEYSGKLKDLTTEISKLELEHVKNYDTKKRMGKINEIINQKHLVIDELESDILRSFIYKMISVNPIEVVFCIAGTKNYTDNEFKERRFEFLKIEPIVLGTYFLSDGLTKMNYRVVVI